MKFGERFQPHPDLRKLYYIYLLAPSVLIFMSAVLPMLRISLLYLQHTTALVVSALVLLPFLLLVGFAAYWIREYYSSISYVLTQNEIVVEKGVWWKHKSTVPYNRITNIDIMQGPLSRRFDLGNVRVQTAGYHAYGGGGRVAEASILGLKNFEEVREYILILVRTLKPVAVEAAAETGVPQEADQQMLAELRRIREILEKQSSQ